MSIGTLLVDRARAIADFEFQVANTDALAEASRHFEANRIALEATCPAAALSLPDELPELEWLYARDGALTARHIDRQWFGDCSVPRRAAERLLAKLEIAGTSAVMLAPSHAQQIRVALDRSTERQAIVAVLPGEYDAGVVLACDDFAAAIRAGRLLVVVGPDWERQLDELLAERVGVAPATTMIRVPGINDAIVDRLLRPCETILNKHGQLHRHHLSLVHGTPRATGRKVERVAVVTGHWHLWRDERSLLAAASRDSSIECATIDTARPDASSALSIARRADGCDALLIANVGRADLPTLVAPGVTWITLLTRGLPPAPSGRDRLVLVDDSQRPAARAAGWSDERVDRLSRVAGAQRAGGRPALAFDLRPVVKPTAIAEMSSHGVVWDRVVSRLGDIGHIETRSPHAMIAGLGEAIGIPAGDLPIDLLRERAAIPTFAVALARRLRRAGVAFDLFGSGWEAVPEVLDCWRGAIADDAAFDAMRANAGALFDVWPADAAHASRRCGLPLIEAWGRADEQVARDARAIAVRAGATATLDLDAILSRV